MGVDDIIIGIPMALRETQVAHDEDDDDYRDDGEYNLLLQEYSSFQILIV